MFKKPYTSFANPANSLFLWDPGIEAFDRCGSNLISRLTHQKVDFEEYRSLLERAVQEGRERQTRKSRRGGGRSALKLRQLSTKKVEPRRVIPQESFQNGGVILTSQPQFVFCEASMNPCPTRPRGTVPV